MVTIPIGHEGGFHATVDVIKKKAIYYEGKNGEHVVEKEIPEDLLEIVLIIMYQTEEKRKELIEKLADVDETLAEKYIMEEEPTEQEIYDAIRRTTVNLKFTPVFVGSAYKNAGV